MILIKFTDVDHVVEKGKPCIVLSGKLVRPIKTVGTESGEAEFEVVTWDNPNSDEWRILPNLDRKVSLVPYPHGTAPRLTFDNCPIYKVWGGPVLFLFCIYDTRFDISECIGRIYSLEEL